MGNRIVGRRRHHRRLASGTNSDSPIKVLVWGPDTAGKTSLIDRFVDDKFENYDYSMARDQCEIKVDSSGKKIDIEAECRPDSSPRNLSISCVLFADSCSHEYCSDSSGHWHVWDDHSYFRTRKTIAMQFYSGIDVFLICFDLGNPIECSHLLRKDYIPMVLSALVDGPCPEAKIVLVGTKSDTRMKKEFPGSSRVPGESNLTSRPWTQKRLDRLVHDSKAVRYVECSAKTGEGVEEVFRSVLEAHLGIGAAERGSKSLFRSKKKIVDEESDQHDEDGGTDDDCDPPIRVQEWKFIDFAPPPCFAGHARVRVSRNRTIPIRELKKGDVVSSHAGESSQVRCVIRIICDVGCAKLVALPDGIACLPWITPWHPVRLEGCAEFSFPCEIVPPVFVSCEVVYNLVLDQKHVVEVNGIDCVSLGHGLTGPVVEHPYFGSDAVLCDLQKMDGWERGDVVMRTSGVKRNETGLVFNMEQE